MICCYNQGKCDQIGWFKSLSAISWISIGFPKLQSFTFSIFPPPQYQIKGQCSDAFSAAVRESQEGPKVSFSGEVPVGFLVRQQGNSAADSCCSGGLNHLRRTMCHGKISSHYHIYKSRSHRALCGCQLCVNSQWCLQQKGIMVEMSLNCF